MEVVITVCYESFYLFLFTSLITKNWNYIIQMVNECKCWAVGNNFFPFILLQHQHKFVSSVMRNTSWRLDSSSPMVSVRWREGNVSTGVTFLINVSIFRYNTENKITELTCVCAQSRGTTRTMNGVSALRPSSLLCRVRPRRVEGHRWFEKCQTWERKIWTELN